MKIDWVKFATELQGIAQIGLAYCKDCFCKERYERLEVMALEMLSKKSGLDKQDLETHYQIETGYPTPKLDVRGAVFKDSKILLVREKSDGKWTLPGGWADLNESPARGVEREIFEESGYTTKAIKLAALYDKLCHEHPPQIPHAYKCFFICEIIKFQDSTSIEIDEIGFFDVNALPELSTHRVVASQIQRMYQHYQQPELPTDFD